MISKEKFLLVIESMQVQYAYDKNYALGLSELINTDDVSMYNNTVLCKSLINLLREWFPKNKEGFCEIEHYCYVLDFGKIGNDYEIPEVLYNRLLSQKTNLVEDDLKQMKNEFWQRS